MLHTTKLALSIHEASLYANIGKTCLYQLISEGKLPAKKMGRKTLILAKDLEAFLSNLDTYPNTGGHDA